MLDSYPQTAIVLRDLDLDQVSLSAQFVQLLFVADSVPRSTFWHFGRL